MAGTCQNGLISYGVISTFIICVLAAFLANCNGQCDTVNVAGDSQMNSATKNDIGLFVLDQGSTAGSEGTSCTCPKWTALTVLEMVVIGALCIFGLWGFAKLIRGLHGIMGARKTRALEIKAKKQEALEKKVMEKMLLKEAKKVVPEEQIDFADV